MLPLNLDFYLNIYGLNEVAIEKGDAKTSVAKY